MASSTNRQSETITHVREPSASPSPAALDFYRHPAGMSQFGRYIPLVAGLPANVEALARIVQGLAIHEYMARAYGITIPEGRKSESHLRPVRQMMERLLGAGEGPLTTPRPPARRLVGVCHHFMLFLVAMLRARGIPARGRCGFGSYFNPGYFEDHWVTEYWNEQEGRWILVDPQFDEVWRRELKIEHDVMDVPRDRFLIAGDAWVQCKEGNADPSKFGIFKGDLRGLWFIACNLVRDVASLNKVEMLPWDVWGSMPQPNQPVTDEASPFFDRLAGLTRSPDDNFEELTSMYQADDRLRVPGQVFNSMLQREEAVEV
jgi:hypothetical protein